MLTSTADIQANKHQPKPAVIKLDDLDKPGSTSWLGLTERRGGHSIGPGCLGCYHQNWDHLTWLCHLQRQRRKRKSQRTIRCCPCNNLPRKTKKERILSLILKIRGCVQIPFYSHYPSVSCRLSADTRHWAFVPVILSLSSSITVCQNLFLNQNWGHGRGGFLIRP